MVKKKVNNLKRRLWVFSVIFEKRHELPCTIKFSTKTRTISIILFAFYPGPPGSLPIVFTRPPIPGTTLSITVSNNLFTALALVVARPAVSRTKAACVGRATSRARPVPVPGKTAVWRAPPPTWESPTWLFAYNSVPTDTLKVSKLNDCRCSRPIVVSRFIRFTSALEVKRTQTSACDAIPPEITDRPSLWMRVSLC